MTWIISESDNVDKCGRQSCKRISAIEDNVQKSSDDQYSKKGSACKLCAKIK